MIDLSQFDGHTEGPWRVEYGSVEGSYENLVIHGPNKKVVVGGCNCCDSPYGSNEKDAHLITAAPELLAEVKRLRSQLAEAIESLDELTLVVGLTTIGGNLNALQDAVDQSRNIINKHKQNKHHD